VGAGSGLKCNAFETRTPEASEFVPNVFSSARANAFLQDVACVINYAYVSRFDTEIDTGPQSFPFHSSLLSNAEAPLHDYGLARSPRAAIPESEPLYFLSWNAREPRRDICTPKIAFAQLESSLFWPDRKRRVPCRFAGGTFEQMEVARAKVATAETFAE
jgi:hypothetical protein